MTEILISVLIFLVIINIIIAIMTLVKKSSFDIKPQLKETEKSMIQFESVLKNIEATIDNEFRNSRKESNDAAQSTRKELSDSFKDFSKQISSSVKDLSEALKQKYDEIKDQQKEFNKQSTDANKINKDDIVASINSFKDSFDTKIKNFNDLLREKFSDFANQQDKTNEKSINNIKDANTQAISQIKDVQSSIEKELKSIREDNTLKLDEMRKTVDEKLQKTLNDRLSQSFETVSKQLQSVQQGLGEMKTLANDVGGLKRTLSNVKMRGCIGEIQLSMLLEQILAPEQYAENVKTKHNSSDPVEFAIKLPGKSDDIGSVWLPIDAKFPKDIYEKLLDAYDSGDQKKIAAAQKELDSAIKKMAKDISEKYLDPPYTTDFGIMFLPFEGIYAEVVRKASLLEELQRTYKVVVTGPTTLAAILNSLQIGFKTLAIQKRSSEVWQVLGAVKTEFDKLGGLMEKAQKNIQTGLTQLDTVVGTRTRAIQRRLKSVESLNDEDTRKILPGITDSDDAE